MSLATRLLSANPGAQVTTALSGSLTTPGAKGAFVNISYESIATVTVGAGGSSTVTFSSIPSTFKHLQIRYSVLISATPAKYSTLRFNGDTTTTNYRYHYTTGDGASVTAGTTQDAFSGWYGSTTAPSVGILDILDYANTNKYKTSRELQGNDLNGSGQINFLSNLWMNTSAINQIVLTINSGNFTQYSSFALYGIKG